MTGFNSKREAAADKLQEPVRETLKLALEALDDMHIVDFPLEDLRNWNKAITAIKEALAQPAQEPVGWMCSAFDGEPCEQTNHDECGNPIPLYTTPPLPVQPVAVLRYQRGTNGRENEMPQVVSCNWLPDGDYQVFSAAQPPLPAQPAQEPPSEWAGIKAILDEYGLQAIDFVADFKAALVQPAQEPTGMLHIERLDRWLDASLKERKPREWVGLTDSDFCRERNTDDFIAGAFFAETKLKERNYET